MNIKMNDIDNSKLEAAMKAYAQDPDKDNLVKLVMAIKDTKLFVPARAIPEKGGFQPYVIKNQEGEMYMPAFTAQAKLPKDQKYQGVLKLAYKQCASMLLDNPTLVQGIALNPFSENLLLKVQMLELTRKVERHEMEVRQQKPKAMQIKADDFRMVTRHNTEFHEIPEKLYAGKREFIESLSEDVLCELYREPYVQMGQAGHYSFTRDSFEIMDLNIRDDLNVIQIVAPAQYLYRTNCRELYIVWNPQTERICYYVIAKGAKDEKDGFYLDVVKEDGSWEQLEDAPAEGSIINRVMELFEMAQGA